MATLSNVTLAVAKSTTNPALVQITIKYRLTPSRVEQMAHSVFNETFSVLGRDYLILPGGAEVPSDVAGGLTLPTRDTPITTVAGSPFAVSESTPHVDRTKVFSLQKSRLNEDPDTTATGSEIADEILARVNVVYAANPPMPPTPPTPAFSSVLTGTWV